MCRQETVARCDSNLLLQLCLGKPQRCTTKICGAVDDSDDSEVGAERGCQAKYSGEMSGYSRSGDTSDVVEGSDDSKVSSDRGPSMPSRDMQWKDNNDGFAWKSDERAMKAHTEDTI